MDCYKLPKIGPSHTLHAYSGSPQRWLVDAQMLRIRTPPGMTRADQGIDPKGPIAALAAFIHSWQRCPCLGPAGGLVALISVSRSPGCLIWLETAGIQNNVRT